MWADSTERGSRRSGSRMCFLCGLRGRLSGGKYGFLLGQETKQFSSLSVGKSCNCEQLAEPLHVLLRDINCYVSRTVCLCLATPAQLTYVKTDLEGNGEFHLAGCCDISWRVTAETWVGGEAAGEFAARNKQSERPLETIYSASTCQRIWTVRSRSSPLAESSRDRSSTSKNPGIRSVMSAPHHDIMQ